MVALAIDEVGLMVHRSQDSDVRAVYAAKDTWKSCSSEETQWLAGQFQCFCVTDYKTQTLSYKFEFIGYHVHNGLH